MERKGLQGRKTLLQAFSTSGIKIKRSREEQGLTGAVRASLFGTVDSWIWLYIRIYLLIARYIIQGATARPDSMVIR